MNLTQVNSTTRRLLGAQNPTLASVAPWLHPQSHMHTQYHALTTPYATMCMKETHYLNRLALSGKAPMAGKVSQAADALACGCSLLRGVVPPTYTSNQQV